MAHLTDTRVEVSDEPDNRVVSFETNQGQVEFIDLGDEPTVEVDFVPVDVTEAASILGDVAEDIGTEAVQVAAGVLADIDEESMFEYFENESDQIILANGDEQLILEGDEAEEYREANQ